MSKLVLIFLGSGAGGLLRYSATGLVQRLTSSSFPTGTLFVNFSGCLLIGFLTAALSGRELVRDDFRIALLVGVLGGYTTFSTFGIETFTLLQDGQFRHACLNVLVSIALCLVAVCLGYRTAEVLLGV
jgi:CrcB protein